MDSSGGDDEEVDLCQVANVKESRQSPFQISFHVITHTSPLVDHQTHTDPTRRCIRASCFTMDAA